MDGNFFMLNKFSQVTLALWVVPLLMAAAPVPPATLDQQLTQCLEKNSSTVGMSTCYNNSATAWDTQINQYYQLLGGDKNTELRNSQIAWLKFRDLEFTWLQKKYAKAYDNSGGGTIWGVVSIEEKMKFLRQRALELRQHHRILTCGMACEGD